METRSRSEAVRDGNPADALEHARRTGAHWDARHSGPASAVERASTYALASPLYQEAYVHPALSDDGIDWVELVRRTICPAGPLDDVLVPGCGSGDGLVDFHRRGIARRVHGIDISEHAIVEARENIRRAGLENSVTVDVADFHDFAFGVERYDAAIFVMSLHHALDVAELLRRVARALKPGGKLVANEYIGPDRWQFGLTQLAAIKILLTLLPRRLRVRIDGTIKGRIGRPSLAWMIAHDPSEAADSSSIPGAIERAFTPILRRDYGGAIALPVLDEIIHRFAPTDGAAMTWLRRILAVDRFLWRTKLVPSANALFIGEKRTAPPGVDRGRS